MLFIMLSPENEHYFNLLLILVPPIIVFLGEQFFFKKINLRCKSSWILSVILGYLCSYILIFILVRTIKLAIKLEVNPYVLIVVSHYFFVSVVVSITIIYLIDRALLYRKGARLEILPIVLVFSLFFANVFLFQFEATIEIFRQRSSWLTLKYLFSDLYFWQLEFFTISSTLILIFSNLIDRFLKNYLEKSSLLTKNKQE